MRLSIPSRCLHRSGAVAVVPPFLLVIVSGLLLQVKKQVPWVQPPEQRTLVREPNATWNPVQYAAPAHMEARVSGWDGIDHVDA